MGGESSSQTAFRAVTLLGDDDLVRALVGDLLVVDLVAVDEDDQVGILLNGDGVVADDAITSGRLGWSRAVSGMRQAIMANSAESFALLHRRLPQFW
jgi:hypothetical protein